MWYRLVQEMNAHPCRQVTYLAKFVSFLSAVPLSEFVHGA
jgi:hypothetical protein